jgi:Ca2+-binding EF-hand superfamily protein
MFPFQFDTSGKGAITKNSLGDALAACGAKVPGFKVRDICDGYTDDSINFDEFCKVCPIVIIFTITVVHIKSKVRKWLPIYL